MLTQPEIRQAFEAGAGLAISVSGGKDSDCMAYLLVDMWRKEGYTGNLQLVHADLGRAEHRQTPEHVTYLATSLDVPLNIVKHSKYDLLDGIKHRMETRPDVPCWPSAKNRYCTSDWKRAPISKWIRNTYPSGTVICAMGLRAEESKARAKKPVIEMRQDCCSKQRLVYNWSPIQDYTLNDVWNELEGRIYHPMYDPNDTRTANDRISCCFCVLASENDLLNGIENDAELYIEYCKIEVISGWSFREKLWLGSLRPELLPDDLRDWYIKKGVLTVNN